MKLARTYVGLFAAVFLGVASLATLHFIGEARRNAPQIHVETTPINRDARLGASFATTVKKAAPSIVNIYSTSFVKEAPPFNPFLNNPILNDPFFRQFAGSLFPNISTNDNRPHLRRKEGIGSGVIVTSDGYILTANHVINGADEIEVATAGNKKTYIAKVIGQDQATDVAVLKIEANKLPAITLADSDKVEVGDIVLALGNPLGVGQTVTMGIVSALGRDGLDLNLYEDFIQTDAAINPGNSGGALVDVEGRLIGINTAIAGRRNQGIGFAVPVNLARNVMEHLITSGKVTRGDLVGVTAQNIDAGLAQSFGLPDQNGALVADVQPDSPAERAGLKSGDVIQSVNGKVITDAGNLNVVTSQLEPGTSTTLKIIRDGQKKTLTVILGQLPEFNFMTAKSELVNNADLAGSTTADALAGVEVQDLNMLIRLQLNAPATLTGALVMEVASDSNSAEAGLLPYDVITEINHQPVANANDAARLCHAAKGGRILLKIWRQTAGNPTMLYLSVDNTKHAN